METSFEWLDELEQNFDNAYICLDTSLDNLLATTHQNELKHDILIDIAENSKERLKQISHLWSSLMDKSQMMYKKQKKSEIEIAALKSALFEAKSREGEIEKLIKILDTANLQIERLKINLLKRQEGENNRIDKDQSFTKTLIQELISEQYDNLANCSRDSTKHEMMDSNNASIPLNEYVHLTENYEFKGSTQVIPCGPVNSELLDPRLKARLFSIPKNNGKKDITLERIKYGIDANKIIPYKNSSEIVNNEHQNNPIQSETKLIQAPFQSLFSVVPRSSLVVYDKPIQNTQHLVSSLALNLNLPASISSILFKKSSSENEDSTLDDKNSKRPTDPRQQCISLLKTEKVNATKPLMPQTGHISNENSIKTANPVFDKIQNILTHGVKPTNVNSNQNNTRKKYVTAENDRFVIKRTKPLENFQEEAVIELKSQLVELYEKEVGAVEFRPELMILRKNKKNLPLETMINIRNTAKIEKLKVFYENNKSQTEIYEMFEDFLSESDLVKSLNHLMSYDFCNNKYNPNKANRKKKNRREKILDNLFDFDNFEGESKNKNEKNENDEDEDDDILYSDIKYFDNDAGEIEDMKLVEETIVLKLEHTAEEDGEIMDSDKETLSVKKPKIESQNFTDTFSKSQKENKHTSSVLKQEEKSKKSSRSSSPRRTINGSSRHRSSRSDSKSRNENSRRSRSVSRSRTKSKESKINVKSRVGYLTKRDTENSQCSKKHDDSASSKKSDTNKDKPLKQSQEVNKNFKRKRYD